VIEVPLVLVDMHCDATANRVCGGSCCPTDKCEATGDGGDACMMADLSVSAEPLFDSARVLELFFGAESCGVFEGCVSGDGQRRLMNFSTTTPNTGNVDLVVGRPEENPFFSYSECHDHYHFEQYADYRLLTLDGEIAAQGHKQAFCLEDLEPYDDDAPEPQFTCDDQGITKGWADTYGRHLDCQWIDITGVAAGDYILLPAHTRHRVLETSAGALWLALHDKAARAHRVHLVSDDGDWLTAYLPLDPERRLVRAPEPWLVKATFGGDDYFGEFKRGDKKWNRILWSGAAPSFLDLGTIPVRRYATVRLYDEGTDPMDAYEYLVRDIVPL
jgi:hypothetical protein